MTEISFYHLSTSSLEQALPKLLEKILEAKKRATVMAGSEERIEHLNTLLWTANRGSFIPHGSKKDGHPTDQPIWLTTVDENPNHSQFLLLVDGTNTENPSSYEKCLHIFDGNDPEAVNQARFQWKKYNEAGYPISYWKQNSSGAWEKADTN